MKRSWQDFTKADLMAVIRGHWKRAEKQCGSIDRMQMHRGKQRYCVGYSWHRPYAHHASGLVHDRILGYGDNREQAMLNAISKIKAKQPT